MVVASRMPNKISRSQVPVSISVPLCSLFTRKSTPNGSLVVEILVSAVLHFAFEFSKMYMAYGWPQVIPLELPNCPSTQHIVYLKVVNSLLIAVGTTHLELWSSSQHRVRLGKYKRDVELLNSHNALMVHNDDTDTLLLQADKEAEQPAFTWSWAVTVLRATSCIGHHTSMICVFDK